MLACIHYILMSVGHWDMVSDWLALMPFTQSMYKHFMWNQNGERSGKPGLEIDKADEKFQVIYFINGNWDRKRKLLGKL